MVSTEWYMPVEDDALVQLQFGRVPSFAVTTTAPPRLKRHAPKVRSGCVTCKARRVKCDETKPNCKRCTSTGRRCDGYNLPKPLLFEIGQDKDERWSFHYYRDRTASQINSVADQAFWNRLVIQVGYSRDIVRHALVAIGSYHEGVDHLDETRRSDKHKFALQQYNKSINGILKSSADSDIEEILLSVILFTFFENVRGEWASALAHLQAGLKIYSNWKAAHPAHLGSTEVSKRVDTNIAPVLAQLQLFVTSLLQMIPAKKSRYSTYMPDHFDDLRTARFYFHQVLHAVCAKLQSNHDEFPWPRSDDATLDLGRRLLYRWHDIWQEFLARAERSCSCSTSCSTAHFELGMYHMQMQYWIAIIRLECKPFREETSFDAHSDKFQTILDVGSKFCDLYMDKTLTDMAKVCIGFEPHYIPVIGATSLRCRDPRIRREAISLIRRWKRTEGKWETLAIADVSEQLMLLEEASARTPNPSAAHDIPNTGRFHLLGCNPFRWNAEAQKFELTHSIELCDLIKFRVIRSGIDPAEQEIEIHWLDQRKNPGVQPLHTLPLPHDVTGFFPQTIDGPAIDSKLWSTLGSKKVAMFLERASISHICQCQNCASQNDLLTSSGTQVQAPAVPDNGVDELTVAGEPSYITPNSEYIPLASPKAESARFQYVT